MKFEKISKKLLQYKIKKNIIRNVKNLQFNFIGGKNSERQNHNFNSR